MRYNRRNTRSRRTSRHRSQKNRRGRNNKQTLTESKLRRMIREELSMLYEYKLNASKLSFSDAIRYAEEQFANEGLDLFEEIPEFERNFEELQKKMDYAIDVPRIEMPVIEPDDMEQFRKKLESGHIDIFKPYGIDDLPPEARREFDGERFPKGLRGGKASDLWLTLGQKDGKKTDDTVDARWTDIPAGKLKPTQSQIWMEKVIGNILKFGMPEQGSPITDAPIIVSGDMYILDGHHRWAQAMVANPSLRMNALYIPIDIELLLPTGRTYGNAIGNKQKQ